MLPSVWVFALKHEERVQKAFLVDHHGPEDARLSHSAKPSLPRGMRLGVRCQGELLGLWDPQNRDLRRKLPPETKF